MTTLGKIKAEIEQKIEQERFARSVFRGEEKDAVKAKQCTGSIMAYDNVIKLIDKYAEQEPCDDVVSRQAVLDIVCGVYEKDGWGGSNFYKAIKELPSVRPQEPKTGHCKDCKYFEYDSVAKIDGVPLIVAHEICNKWGDGCKTKEDGYCYLFEPKERSE